jgi:hypothetical protein
VHALVRHRHRIWFGPKKLSLINNRKFKNQSGNNQTLVTAVVHISSDDVCCERTGIESTGARQVRLKNCAQRNRGLGFGTPPACGDGTARKPPNPDAPQLLLTQMNPWH